MVGVKHKFQSAFPTDPAATAAGELTPDRWNDEHEITGLGATDTPTFAGIVLTDAEGNKWLMTATVDGNVSLEQLVLP